MRRRRPVISELNAAGRALIASITHVAEKMEAIVAQFERTPDVLPDDPSGHS